MRGLCRCSMTRGVMHMQYKQGFVQKKVRHRQLKDTGVRRPRNKPSKRDGQLSRWLGYCNVKTLSHMQGARV